MILVYIVLGFVAVLLIAGYICFRHISVRGAAIEITEGSPIERPVLKPYQQQMRESWQWLAEQKMEMVEIRSADGLRLVGHYLRTPNSRGLLLGFHGYRSCYQIDLSCALPYYASLGFDLLLVEQRAHQNSGGRYITYGVKERYDVQSWVAYANRRFGPQRPVFLAGLSMGATTVQMACGLELPKNVCGVISDCGFSSPYEIIRAVVQRRMGLRWLWWLIFPMLELYCRTVAGFGLKEYSTLEAQKRNQIPTLFIHGTADKLVPYEMTRANYAACQTPDKELLLVEGAGHGVSYLVDKPSYEKAVAEFLTAHLPEENHAGA